MKSAQILRSLFFDPTVNDDIQVAEELAVLDRSKSNLCFGDFCQLLVLLKRFLYVIFLYVFMTWLPLSVTRIIGEM